MKTTKCRHFNGVMNEQCKAGICYGDVRKPNTLNAGASFPCLPKMNTEGASCPKYDPWTEEELKAQDAEHERTMALIARDMSPCCEAPIDKSRVIESGRHKGHGPRFCSACKKLVYMV